jgi:pimeloyl-ACP methyl ester carboxylesterase
MQSLKNVVLVHGAWADGSSWSKIVPLLQTTGLHVACAQIPLSSIADDVASTNRTINAQDGPVLLVGHSYGGAVITVAGDNPKVSGLVYVAAFARLLCNLAFHKADLRRPGVTHFARCRAATGIPVPTYGPPI